MRKLVVLTLVLALGLGLSLAGQQQPQRGGVLRLAVEEEPPGFDPTFSFDTASQAVTWAIYVGLFRFDPATGAAQPAIAKSFSVSDDRLTYTFPLRDDVFFQDDPAFPGGVGRQVVCADLAYSLTRHHDATVIGAANISPSGLLRGPDGGFLIEGANEFNAGQADSISGITCPDDFTLQIKIRQPFATFLTVLGTQVSWAVPREAVEFYGDSFVQNPVGAGAFRRDSFIEGVRFTLNRHPRYFEVDQFGTRLPYLDRIEIRRINDDAVEFLEFDLGNLDLLNEAIPTERFDEVVNLQNPRNPDGTCNLNGRFAQQYVCVYQPQLNTHPFFGFTFDTPSDPQHHFLSGQPLVRQALNFAIDRELIINQVRNGRGFPADSPVPPGIAGFPLDAPLHYTYDPERARRLLAQAGFPNGQGIPPLTLLLFSGGTTELEITEAIQAQIAEIGVAIELQVVPFSELLTAITSNHPPDMFVLGWVFDYPDPQNILQLFFSRNIPDFNWMRFSDPEFDALYLAALSEPDAAKRTQLYVQLDQMVSDKAPWLFILHDEDFRLQAKNLRDFPLSAQAFLRAYERAWFE